MRPMSPSDSPDRPSRLEDGLELDHLLEARISSGTLIGVDKHSPGFPNAYAHRDDLVFEPARIDCRDGPGMAGIRKFILFFPGDPVLVREILGRHPHGEGAVDVFGLGLWLALGVRIEQLTVPGLVTIACAAKVVGSCAH